jgi:hypothetical protein
MAARAQQPVRMRRIGVMLGLLAADDPEGQARVTAFVQALQERGWTDGRNVRIEFRWVRATTAERVVISFPSLTKDDLPAGRRILGASTTTRMW